MYGRACARFVSGTIHGIAYDTNGKKYLYAGWYSTDGGETVMEGEPATMEGITGNKALTLYFVERGRIEATIPTLPDPGKTYDGTAVETPTVKVVGDSGSEIELEYIWEKKNPDGTYTELAEAPKDAGDYRITAKVPDDDPDYFGQASRKFTIAKKAVTITVRDKSIQVGKAVPSLADPREGTDYTVEGLVKGESLLAPPTLRYQKGGADVTPDSGAPGTYEIVADSAVVSVNYTLAYARSGTLTVRPREGGGSGGGSSGGGGGGSTIIKYPIDMDSSGNGSATSDKDKAAKGETVTVTTDGNVKNITVTDGDGKQIPITDQGNGKYTFQMPGSGVKVSVVFQHEDTGVTAPDSTGVSARLNTGDHMAYIVGDETGIFAPHNNITRAEVAQMFYRLLLDKTVERPGEFPDVAADAWYHQAVSVLAGKGYLLGTDEGVFQPERPITRAEFATIAARFAKASTEKVISFPDVPTNEWYCQSVQTAVSYSWIRGYEDGTFRPDRPITRTEAVAIVNRMLARIPDRSAVDNGAGTRFPDVPDSFWGFYGIVEASTGHDYSRPSSTAEETWK